MTWQEHYAIARSLRQRADWLFGRNETQYACEGIWGALHYASKALAERFGRTRGQSLRDGHIPTRPNAQNDVRLRIRQWRASNLLHRHFYNSNLSDNQLVQNRAEATGLLEEAFAALDSHTT